jgi:hypothetical protein
MLTGRAAELRPDINDLRVTEVVLVAPEDATQPYMTDGEYALLLRQWSRQSNAKRVNASRARNASRDIPTSGAERRRAKNHRQRGLCLEHVAATTRCTHQAVDGGRCARHTPDEDA